MTRGKSASAVRTSPDAPKPPSPAKILEGYKVATDIPLYLVGAFDAHVTVLGQQIRALNLAWALIEAGILPTGGDDRKQLAIIGAGFAGLTLAAALLQKRTALDITIFEERDTLLPLQQGSDSRWLHPQIYDWPAGGSEASAAMLPVLNWTAGRASDVVVQALTEWRSLFETESVSETVHLFCNTRHLQIDRCPQHANKAQIEWVGEPRNPSDGNSKPGRTASGASKSFDFVIMTTGFGLERDTTSSYWRNETLGQPSLSQARATYLVSGQGDGAMIDLLRLRVSQYRQDRILEELFSGKDDLLRELKILRAGISGNIYPNLFQQFEALGGSSEAARRELGDLMERLGQRLRRDTDAILHLRVRDLSHLFGGQVSRMSFQNALLVYLLYKCGGFTPSTEKERVLTTRLAIRPEHIVRRHGTRRLKQFRRLLSEELYTVVRADQISGGNNWLHQGAQIQWKGGYFGIPGRLSDMSKVTDSDRQSWRKEYLPGPTALMASTMCGAIAGAVKRLKPKNAKFRVTLHRVLEIHKDELLQQACDYLGHDIVLSRSAAGRTFPTDKATIGLAYSCRRIVRSVEGIEADALQIAMGHLDLHYASRDMAPEVGFVLAIPILQPDEGFFGSNPVSGVIYIDSKTSGFWLSNSEIAEICVLIKHALDGVQDGTSPVFDRLRNIRPGEIRGAADIASTLPSDLTNALELLADPPPPATAVAFHFNFDHSDLTPITFAIAATPSSAVE